MPEIAEVETVRNTLKERILNKKISDVIIYYDKIIASDKGDFVSVLKGKRFKDIKRIGKWLLFDVGSHYLLSHLRMEGKFFIKNSDEDIEKHEHVIIRFDDNTDLRYHDTRKFGRMHLVLKEELNSIEAIKNQGIEPNDENLTKEYLHSRFQNKNIPIKNLLLDQSIISGLGNIYANEVLFEARINPLRKGKDISLDECQRLVDASNKIISEAIKQGGTTIKSYTSSLGVTGRFQQFLKVHKREGEACLICGSKITRIKLTGRSAYYCDKCQK